MNIHTNDPVRCEVAVAALKQVIDPEIGLNIVDLGLIYQVDFDTEQPSVYLLMTLTTQFCPMGEYITGSAKRVLENAFGLEIQLELTFDPAWTRERISESGQAFLNQN